MTKHEENYCEYRALLLLLVRNRLDEQKFGLYHIHTGIPVGRIQLWSNNTVSFIMFVDGQQYILTFDEFIEWIAEEKLYLGSF